MARKTSIEAPRTNADTETQMFSGCRWDAYVATRRGIPIRPSANNGPKVELKAMNIVQKWIFARRSLNRNPVIFGTQ